MIRAIIRLACISCKVRCLLVGHNPGGNRLIESCLRFRRHFVLVVVFLFRNIVPLGYRKFRSPLCTDRCIFAAVSYDLTENLRLLGRGCVFERLLIHYPSDYIFCSLALELCDLLRFHFRGVVLGILNGVLALFVLVPTVEDNALQGSSHRIFSGFASCKVVLCSVIVGEFNVRCGICVLAECQTLVVVVVKDFR